MFARIYLTAKNAMQSGAAKTGKWVLEFDTQTARAIDPLMGWTGASDTLAGQTRLFFESQDDAAAYATERGIPFTVEPAREKKTRAKAYSDNFSFKRRQPWTH